MLSNNEVKVLDGNSEFFGVPTSTLMENAGKHVAAFVIKNYNPRNVMVFCGIGNNGGDGFVAARHLSEKYNVTVIMLDDGNKIKSNIAQENFQKLLKLNVRINTINRINDMKKTLDKYDAIIDAMLGIGISGELREPYALVVKTINAMDNKTVVSVDVPTGLGTDLAVKPDVTITFHDKKVGMNAKNCGKIIVAEIGIPKKAVDYVGPGELKTYYPKPYKNSHKGDNGRLLVVGGGPYIGAPALAGLAAMRTGADLVYIATPQRVGRAITSFSPEFIKPKRQAQTIAKLSPNLIVKKLSNGDILTQDDVVTIKDLLSKCDAMVIGPGLGENKATQDAVIKIIKICVLNNKPLIVDADAIAVVGKKPDLVTNSKTVLTPHAGEFRDLTGETLSANLDEKRTIIKHWAKKLGVTILLKGDIDIISEGFNVKLNDVHNPAMTVGGTGDVLAGIVGALLSKNVEPYNAARMGAFVNGSAGNEAFKKKSYGLIATDVIEEIPNILRKYI